MTKGVWCGSEDDFGLWIDKLKQNDPMDDIKLSFEFP